MFFENVLDYIVILFQSTFQNIPNEGNLSTIYLIGNFILLVLAGLSNGSFGILSKGN